MDIVNNFQKISNNIVNKNIAIIAVSKTFRISQIMPLIHFGHKHFGENKVQETLDKWAPDLLNEKNIQLHMLGKLQSNKVDDAVKMFSYIHSLDNEKLALKLHKAELKYKKNLKYFIQVNLGNENQKSGIALRDLSNFCNFCISKYNLNIIGLMCLPPINEDSKKYFVQLRDLAYQNNFKQLSMGMSNDYKLAIESGSTFVRIGSQICGSRS